MKVKHVCKAANSLKPKFKNKKEYMFKQIEGKYGLEMLQKAKGKPVNR